MCLPDEIGSDSREHLPLLPNDSIEATFLSPLAVLSLPFCQWMEMEKSEESESLSRPYEGYGADGKFNMHNSENKSTAYSYPTPILFPCGPISCLSFLIIRLLALRQVPWSSHSHPFCASEVSRLFLLLLEIFVFPKIVLHIFLFGFCFLLVLFGVCVCP